MASDQFEIGLAIRKEVLGADYVEASLAKADDFNRDFQHMVTEHCWGGSWGRGVLTKQQRSILNLGMLAALNRQHEFKLHLLGALTNGVSLKEIREVLIQIAILDIVFSLDSVIIAIGMAEDLSVMITAVVIAIIVMMLFAERVSRFVKRHPTLKVLALSFLILIGVMLTSEAMGMSIKKGYIYFAMAFALFVEFLNLRLRARRNTAATSESE